MALGSPDHPSSALSSPGLSRNPSIASGALSRSASNASSPLSRNASLARSRSTRAANVNTVNGEQQAGEGPLDEGDEQQKKTEERQEARSNLIRKLSRGRLAQGAAAAARERAGVTADPVSPESLPPPADSRTSPASLEEQKSHGLQRRPSLADLLTRAESRSQQRREPNPGALPLSDQLPSSAVTSNGDTSAQPSPFSFTPLTGVSSPAAAPSSAASFGPSRSLGDAFSPSSSSSTNSRFGPRSVASTKGMYDHIPVPPVPETPSSSVGSPNGQLRTLPSHESMYSAVSNFRPYRHTVERDRDSAIARMQMEDNFEFELGTESDGPHERHPLSAGAAYDEQGQPGQDSQDAAQRHLESETRTQLSHSTPPRSSGDLQLKAPQPVFAGKDDPFSPPDSPLDARMIPSHDTGNVRQESSPSSLQKASASQLDRHSATEPSVQRMTDSMPETPEMVSPISPFSFTPAPLTGAAPAFPSSQEGPPIVPPPAQQQQHEIHDDLHFSQPSNPFSFTKHHESNMSTDSFPISMAASHNSRHPQSMVFPLEDQPPPLPSAEPPLPNHQSSGGIQMSSQDVPLSASSSQPLSAGTPTFQVRPLDTGAGIRDKVPTIPVSEYRFPTSSSRSVSSPVPEPFRMAPV